MFFCVGFMPRTTNNSLATTMFEGDSEDVPSTGADIVSSAGSSVLQAGQNISTSSDALAQAMSKALTDSLPGILAALRTHNAVPSQPAPPNSNPAMISTSSLAPLTQASLSQATTTGNFIVPSFVSTFSTLSTPAYGFSSLPLPSSSGSPTVGGGVVSAFPAISVSSAAVGKDFVIGPGYSPIPHKLVTKITTGLFVELADLLPDNLKVNESETQTFLEGKLVVAPARKRIVEIQDILTWVEAFTIYSIVLCASQPARWADLSHYKLLIIQTAKKFSGKAWQLYDTAFRKNAAASGLKDWSKMNPDLYNFHTLVQTPSSSGTSHPKASASHSGLDHTPTSSQFCHSWNEGHCRWPFGRCRFRHACQDCQGDHRSVSCPFRTSRATRRSRSPTPLGGKRRRR